MIYQGQGRAGHYAEAAQGNADGHPNRDGNPQAQGSHRAAGHLFRLERHGDQGRFRNRRRKTDGRSKSVDQAIISPVNLAVQFQLTDGPGRGKLLRHSLPDWEKGFFQADEEKGQAEKHHHEPDRHPAWVGEPPPQHGHLEHDQDSGDGCDVQHRGQQGVQQSKLEDHAIIP